MDFLKSMAIAASGLKAQSGRMRVIATIAGRSAYEIGVKPGSTLAAHATAQGKLLLAFGGDAVIERSLAKAPSRNTPFTVTERTPLRAELDQIRRQGWATAPNQSIIGLNALDAEAADMSIMVGSTGTT